MVSYFDSLAQAWDEGDTSSLEEFLLPLDIKKGQKVLDLACGKGVITPYLYQKSQTKVKAIDLSTKMIEGAKERYKDNPNLEFKALDFYELKDGGYDYIVCFNAYPHFLDTEAFVKSLYANLNKDGRFAICHNLGRKGLQHCHEGKDIAPLSRDLLPVEKEIEVFLPYFRILKAEENEESYWIIGGRV